MTAIQGIECHRMNGCGFWLFIYFIFSVFFFISFFFCVHVLFHHCFMWFMHSFANFIQLFGCDELLKSSTLQQYQIEKKKCTARWENLVIVHIEKKTIALASNSRCFRFFFSFISVNILTIDSFYWSELFSLFFQYYFLFGFIYRRLFFSRL